jgi:D-lactate dehydrogenase
MDGLPDGSDKSELAAQAAQHSSLLRKAVLAFLNRALARSIAPCGTQDHDLRRNGGIADQNSPGRFPQIVAYFNGLIGKAGSLLVGQYHQLEPSFDKRSTGEIMRVAVFSTKPYDRTFLQRANDRFAHDLTFFEPRLTSETSTLAGGFAAVCVFVNDILDATVLERLAEGGLTAVALRCAGFNNVDLEAAEELGIKVVRVPSYSPHAVAEHTVGLMLTLNRKIHRAFARVREGNFSLDGLLGFDLHGRTVGIIGTGQIGAIVARIMSGFGCRLLGCDLNANPDCIQLGLKYVSLDELLPESDIVTLHCPLTPDTRYLINAETIEQMKRGVMLINTSRGAVIDTKAVIEGLKHGRIGSLGLDVYEEEADYFFEDLSQQAIADDVLARLLTFPNVLVTGHQAFFTHEALEAIADTILHNLREIEETGRSENEVTSRLIKGRQ